MPRGPLDAFPAVSPLRARLALPSGLGDHPVASSGLGDQGGGVGLRASAHTLHTAYVSSRLACAPMIQACVPALAGSPAAHIPAFPLPPSLPPPPPPLPLPETFDPGISTRSLHHALSFLSLLPAIAGDEASGAGAALRAACATPPAVPRHLQRILTRAVHSDLRATLIPSLESITQRRSSGDVAGAEALLDTRLRWLTASDPARHLPLTTFPTHAALCFSRVEWRCYLRDYLGLPQPAVAPFADRECASCSGVVDRFGAHAWSCRARAGLCTEFHHGIVALFVQAINEVRPLVADTSNIADYLGPTVRGNSHLPDIVVHGFSHGRPVLLDVSFVNPFCSTYRAHAARGRLVMARKRAQEKKANYATYNPAQHHFIPLAAEFGGGPCDEWRDFLDTLSRCYAESPACLASGLTPEEARARYLLSWRRIFACRMAKAQATFVAASANTARAAALRLPRPFGQLTSASVCGE
jgi:hypothetical protein